MSGIEIPLADIVLGSVPTFAFVRDLWISLSLYFVQVVEQLKRSSVCAFSQTSELARFVRISFLCGIVGVLFSIWFVVVMMGNVAVDVTCVC